MTLQVCMLMIPQMLLLFGQAPKAPAATDTRPPARRAASPWVEVRPVTVKNLGMPKARMAGTKLPSNHPTIKTRRGLPANHPPIKRKGTSRAQGGLPANHPPIKRGTARKRLTGSRGRRRLPPGARPVFGRGRGLSKARIQQLMGFYLSRIQANKRSNIRLTREQDQRARGLADVIMTPCCYTQPASIHGNAVAGAVKATLKWLVSQGYTDQQIKQAFVRAYHPHVLSASSKKSIFVIPLIVAVLALIFVGFLVTRWTRRGGATTPEGAVIDVDELSIAEDVDGFDKEYGEYEVEDFVEETPSNKADKERDGTDAKGKE